MTSRIEKMLAKTQMIRAAKDIPDSEIVRSAQPKTAVGTMAAWQSAQARIQELEKLIAESCISDALLIPVDSISTNPWQPRRVFDEGELQKLACSIAEIGLIQPIIVRRVPNRDTDHAEKSVPNRDTRYQLIAGERRWRAHRVLGKSEIKAIVINASDEEMAALALAENFDREDLTAYEIALAIRNAESAFPNRKSLADAMGINRSDLYRYMAFFQMPDFVIKDLEIQPGLLGRHAAEEIAAAIKKYGQTAIDLLRQFWPRVKAAELDQGKVALLIESAIAKRDHEPVKRDIRKLFVAGQQAGSITRDARKLKIEIKAVALTPESESKLRKFIEEMFESEKLH